MTDSMRRPMPTGALPQPNDLRSVERTWQGYQAAVSRMSNEELLRTLTDLNVQLQAQAQTSMTSPLLSELRQSLDRPVLSSTPREPLSPPVDRGSRPFQSPPPGALDLLARSRSLGPRVAGKLVLAQVRARR